MKSDLMKTYIQLWHRSRTRCGAGRDDHDINIDSAAKYACARIIIIIYTRIYSSSKNNYLPFEGCADIRRDSV